MRIAPLAALVLLACDGEAPTDPPPPPPTDVPTEDTGVTPEDCANGSDDDGDGLLDCEDGDCADQAPCTELCTNGIDDDGDALVDCDDDVCWGIANCPVRVAVSGGSYTHRMMKRSSFPDLAISTPSSSFSIPSGWFFRTANELQLHDVSGTLRGLGHTCAWSFTYGLGRHTLSGSEVYSTALGTDVFQSRLLPHDVVRSGLVVESGCGFDTGGFLPARLYGASGRIATAAGAPWYVGTPAGSTSTFQALQPYIYARTTSWFVSGVSVP